MAIEPILVNGAILDKGCAMFLVSKSHVASAAFYHPVKRAETLEATNENLNKQMTTVESKSGMLLTSMSTVPCPGARPRRETSVL